jgi:diguanylate cyclase (GGDEF)-like protein/PAS domain S-box-containing protein
MDHESSNLDSHQHDIDNGVFEHAAIGLAYINLNGRFLKANQAFQKHLGYSPDSISTLNLEDILHPDDLGKIQKSIQALVEHSKTSEIVDCRCFNSIGNINTIRLMLSVMNNADKKPIYIIAAIEKLESINNSFDTQPNKSFERHLFESIADKVPSTVWLSSIDLKTLHYANKAFFELWQVTPEQFEHEKGYDILKHIHPDDVESVRSRIKKGLTNGDTWDQNFRILNEDGSVKFIEDKGTVLRDEQGNAIYFLGTHHDITEQVHHTAQLETLNQELQNAYNEVTRLNQFDTLTGCYNRTAILDHLSNAYYQFTRYEIPSSLIYIDLNHFKEINDDYGHLVGDEVLKNFVLQMQDRIRQTDILGRLGGDEFLLLFPGTSKYNAENFLKKEKKAFSTKINADQTLIVSYSVGVADLDFNMQTIEEWIDAADKLMYQQKVQQRND